jgi:hypothetical protein
MSCCYFSIEKNGLDKLNQEMFKALINDRIQKYYLSPLKKKNTTCGPNKHSMLYNLTNI